MANNVIRPPADVLHVCAELHEQIAYIGEECPMCVARKRLELCVAQNQALANDLSQLHDKVRRVQDEKERLEADVRVNES